MTTIGGWAFEGCSGLTEVTIGNGLTSIGNSAFFECNKLAQIAIPDSVTAIEESAFYNCKSLAVIRIPDSVTRLEANPFTGCNQLNVILSPDHPTLSFSDGALLSRDGTRLIAYTRSHTNPCFTVPETVTVRQENIALSLAYLKMTACTPGQMKEED